MVAVCMCDVVAQNGKVNSLDFHRTEDRLVTASDDESIRLYDTTNGTSVKRIPPCGTHARLLLASYLTELAMSQNSSCY